MSEYGGRPLGSQYLLETLIGRGGMGEVWRGTDRSGQAFAFKLLLPQLAEDPGMLQRFLAERSLLTSVRHPNVVGVHDMVAEGNSLAIVMELVQGTDLRSHLKANGTLAPTEACRIAAEVAQGLGAIHASKIVHRDIKPENILLDTTWQPLRVKLTDFGVAKLVDETAEKNRATMVAGTPLYMAPEVINGAIPSARSDMYALGIVLYEMLVGVTPFTGMAPGPAMRAHLNMLPGRPVGISDDLWKVISRLTSKDPMDRPRDGQGIATRLEELSTALVGQPPLSRLTVPPPGTPTSWSDAMHGSGVPLAPTQVAMRQPMPGPSPVPTQMPAGPGTSAPIPVGVWHSGMSYPGQVSYPGLGGYLTPAPMPIGPARPPQPVKGRGPVVAGIIVGLALVALALMVTVVLSMDPDGPGGATGSEIPAAAEESQHEQSTSTSPTEQDQPENAWPPANTLECTDSVRVNDVTSCPFATNVADAYRTTLAPEIRAYSPVTDTWYEMQCGTMAADLVVCTGGNAAQVFIRR